MIALMDDVTRFIVGADLITDEIAATCTRSLATILATGIRPCGLGSDNGENSK
jgi:hypothetical protein